ncbi:hypothetical protein JCGZ_02418 [Jatropha curcas]|uniref:Uncharacterized protein n=1 Tax=Jatropha curcas TaxID=180498 RepID=A0A067LF11_JATCU|nr:hypothetical protein JCGZ_02418 [Jatropha curcas]
MKLDNRLVFCVPSTVASRNCSLEDQFRDAPVHQRGKALNSCVAQLLRCVAQLWRCVAHLWRCVAQLVFRVRNLGKLRDAAVQIRDAAM